MPWTPSLRDTSGDSSTFSLATLSLPAYRSASRSTMGETIRHGPHQGAQASTRTGRGLASTVAAKSALRVSTSHGRSAWHEAHRGRPDASAGTRLRVPHWGHGTTSREELMVDATPTRPHFIPDRY